MGNGRLGAMVFGRVVDDRLPINEISLWDGHPRDTTNPEALANLPEVRRLLFAGKNEEATALAGQHLMGRPTRIRPYQVLADLWLESPAPSQPARLPPRARPRAGDRPRALPLRGRP